MARKHKTARDAATGVLLPQVTERESASDTVRSEEEQRALDAVASIEKVLFGTTEKARTAAPTPEREVKAPTSNENAPSKDASPAPDELAPFAEALIGEDEGEVIEPVRKTIEEPSEVRNKALAETSEDDFRFLLDMDYENELGNTIGFEKIRSYHEKEMNGYTSARRRQRNGLEFDTQTQDTEIHRNYAKQRAEKILRLVFSLLLFLLLVVYERPGTIAKWLGGPFNGATYPVSYILVGIQLLLLDAALFYRPLCEGFLRLLCFSPVDYSFTSLLVIATFLYNFVQIFISHNSYPVLYLSPAALGLVLLSCVEFLNWYRESLSFSVVAARRQKYALVSRISVGGKWESAKERLHLDGDGGHIQYARPIGFVRNYFANTAQHMEHHRNLGAQVILTLALGVALGLFVLAGGADGEMMFRTVFTTMLLAAPVASLLLTSVPMFFATVLRLRGKAAIIGERPIAECGVPATVVLPDNEIFIAMEHEHFRLMENCDLHNVSVLTRALLECVESPLSEAFMVDAESRIPPNRLTLLEIENEGVHARVNESGVEILIGTVSYLKENHIPVRGLADDIPASVYNRLLCVAMDGRVAAIFLVRYRLADDVRSLLRAMDRMGVPVAVRTKDPCVREEVLARLVTHVARSVQVIKPSVKEMELRAERVDTTVVSTESCKELARAYVTCRRIRRVGVWGKLLLTFSMVLGAMLAALLALLHIAPSALFVTVWLTVWCALYAMLSYTFLRRQADESEGEI